MILRCAKKISAIITCLLISFSFSLCYSQEAGEPSPQEIIKEYKEVLEVSEDPAEIAEAHYNVGYALEQLGRKTEATAEYLKIIVNYPRIEEVNKKTEKRLSELYSGFRDKSRELIGKREEIDGAKDPAIFFAYIKSLYESHRNSGQYDRAMHVLERLYDMDSENPSYLIDMGEIYLDGYNDADKAIFHFKKAIEAAPDNTKAYVDLGRAYEKKGDYDMAVKVYAKAAEISPASPWAIYGLRRIDGIRLSGEKRLIKDWYFAGPFDNSEREGLGKVFPPEKKIELDRTYSGKDEVPVKWVRSFDYDSSGYVDLNMLFKPNDYAVAYALTYAYSPGESELQFRFGSEDGIKIWVNEKEVFAYDATRSAELDDDAVTVKLKKGWNKILVKITDTWGAWGFYFRVTDLKGAPVEDLIFDPTRDDQRRKLIYRKMLKQRRFKITKIATIYTIALSVFLFGLYFMISNIHGRIKITRMKEDFISSVSHELKTPIAAVKMLAETLKRGKVKGPVRVGQYHDMIIRESDRLTRFISKILDFAKIEKGGKVFYFEKENMRSLAESAVSIYRDETQDKDLKISFSAERDELFAEIDKDAILQVIINLMDNAYKYSKKEKEINVNVRNAGENVCIDVADKGRGIAKGDIEKIFDKFYRADRDMVEGIKGSGLGLAFVKSVIDGHGGRIAVESEVGKGTKFIISLPVKRA